MSSNSQREKHKRIMEAAIRVFARKGFHNSRIQEIAEAAGVASGTIYLYFKNKDDLLITIFEQSLDRIIKEMKEDLADIEGPDEKLRRFIWHHLELMKRRRDLAEVMQVELRQSHKFMKEYEPRHWIAYIDIIADILDQGQKQGVFRQDLSLGVFKRAVFGALDEIALHWVRTGKGERYLDNAAQELSKIVVEGIARGSAAKKKSARAV